MEDLGGVYYRLVALPKEFRFLSLFVLGVLRNDLLPPSSSLYVENALALFCCKFLDIEMFAGIL